MCGDVLVARLTGRTRWDKRRGGTTATTTTSSPPCSARMMAARVGMPEPGPGRRRKTLASGGVVWSRPEQARALQSCGRSRRAADLTSSRARGPTNHQLSTNAVTVFLVSFFFPFGSKRRWRKRTSGASRQCSSGGNLLYQHPPPMLVLWTRPEGRPPAEILETRTYTGVSCNLWLSIVFLFFK